MEHMWWRCPAWASLRHKHAMAMQGFSDGWPNCLKCCGIVPTDLEGLEDSLAHCAAEHSDEDDAEDTDDDSNAEEQLDRNAWHGQQTLWVDGKQVVFTDGV